MKKIIILICIIFIGCKSEYEMSPEVQMQVQRNMENQLGEKVEYKGNNTWGTISSYKTLDYLNTVDDSILVIERKQVDTIIFSKKQFEKYELNFTKNKKRQKGYAYNFGFKSEYPNYKYSSQIRRYLWKRN